MRQLSQAFVLLLGASALAVGADDGLRPYAENPFYWQYRGTPVLLLGASDDDNLFQWPENKLKEQLERMVAAGANYVRNTMSDRDDGNLRPFALQGERYDLAQWNEEYWDRFANFLRLTGEYGVFVQIEFWDLHDFHREQWDGNPWNPAFNVTYRQEETRLKRAYGNPMREAHDFFLSVPALNNDVVLLAHQRRFVERILAVALEHDHVLYCVDNEIHSPVPPEWGWYWARFARETAARQGKRIEITEMLWQTDFFHEELRASLDHPETYSFFEASQNSANTGQVNWDYLQHVRRHLMETKPRPINNTKIYGADTGPSWAGSDSEAQARFWRNVFGGSASSRFHRPPTGLGAGPKALANVRSMRMLAAEMDVFVCEPHNELLADRAENEAYCMAEPGTQYAVYFPDGGEVKLDVSAASGVLQVRWLNISASAWQDGQPTEGGGILELRAPGPGQWAVWVCREL